MNKLWIAAFVYEYHRRSELPMTILVGLALLAGLPTQDITHPIALAFFIPALAMAAIRVVTGFANIELERRAKWYPVDFADVRKMAIERPFSTGEARGL